MKKICFTCAFVSLAVLGGAAAPQIPNAGFEQATDGKPVGWKLSAENGSSGTWCATGGVSGAALRVTGDGAGASRWLSDGVMLDPNRLYAFSFKTKGRGTGCLVSGPGCANVDLPFDASTWTTRSFVFRSATRPAPYAESFHLGQWHGSGEILFDDVSVEPVRPVYARVAGFELGPGEELSGNRYAFGTSFGGPARNHARPLLSATAGFNTDRWWVSARAEIVYTYALPKRTWTAATLTAQCGWHAAGAAALEVSRDGTSWRRVATIDKVSTVEAAVPVDLLPADRLFVRVVGQAECSLQIYACSFEATFAGEPVNGCGAAQFVSETTGRVVAEVKACEYFRDDYGERLTAAEAPVALWRASSGWKIPRFRRLPTATASAVRVATAANEAEAVQIVVTPRAALADARVSVASDLTCGAAVLSASAVEVLRVGYVPVRQPTDAAGCRGLWPDPLPPQTSVCPVDAGANQPFWIRVKPPKGTTPGVYAGSLAVTTKTAAGATQTQSVPFEVEVFGFTLPDRMTCETAFGFSTGRALRYHGLTNDVQRRAVVDKYLAALSAHHISPYNPAPFAHWTVTWKGWQKGGDPQAAEPVFDWTAWDAAVEKAFSTYHFNTICLPIEGLGGGTYESRREPSLLGVPATDPAYDILMGKYLRGIESHLREKGWLDKAYVYWFDEPEPKDYAFVMNGFKTLKKHAPGLRRMLTEEAVEELAGGPNLWVPLTPNLHVAGEQAARQRGDAFWWYVCCGPKAPYVTEFIDHPGVEMRLWLWQTWGADVAGVLIWETVFWTSATAYPEALQNPYADAMSWVEGAGLPSGAKRPWGNGDGRLLYPPEAAASGRPAAPVLAGPVDSYRLELLRDGIEDYEYFAMLKRALAAAKDLTPAERAAYAALLAVPSGVSVSLTEFATDPAALEAHRLKLARALERLCAK